MLRSLERKWDDDRGSASGAAYIYERVGGNWTQTQKLVPAVIVAGGVFGIAADISGTRAVVRAYSHS